MEVNAKNYSKLLAKLTAAGTAVRDTITELALYAAAQARMNNINPAVELVNTVSAIRGQKVKALTAWFCLAAPLKVSNGQLQYSRASRKAHSDVDFEIAALARPWYEIDSEKAPEKVLRELDVQSMYIAFMKRLKQRVDEVSAAGGEIKHAELLTKLQQGIVGIEDTSTVAIAEPAKF